MDIHEAAENGDVEQIRELLLAAPDHINNRSVLGDTALHCAASQKQTLAAKLLVKLGADVNAKGNRGRTPLHCAAASGAVAIARLLIKLGADLEADDDGGETPVLTAIKHVEDGRLETKALVKLLLKGGARYDLESAVLNHDTTRVQAILSMDPNALGKMSKDKQVLLVHAALDDPLVIELLLQHGGDPNARNKKDAFAWAPITQVNDPRVAEILLRHGANVNATNAYGFTRLQIAKKEKETEMQKILLRVGEKSSSAEDLKGKEK